MATYHQCLVLLATSLLVSLLPRTVLGQGEQHVNFCCIASCTMWVGVNKRAAVSVDCRPLVSCSQKERVWYAAHIRVVPCHLHGVSLASYPGETIPGFEAKASNKWWPSEFCYYSRRIKCTKPHLTH